MDFIKFLGTAGARFVMIKQLRASGGIWLKYKSTNILIDPGPGSIVKCNSSRPKLNPAVLDAIILTHKHLDHSSDINVMIEAMTEAGFKKRGVVFITQDSLGQEGVIFPYLKNHPKEIKILKKGKFSIGDIEFEVACENIHGVQTYGLKFFMGEEIVSFVSDTKYFGQLPDIYKDSTVLILNVVFYKENDKFQHFCLDDALKMIKAIKPKKTILTHFGMSMLKAKPHQIEQELREELGMDIKCAYDGMIVEINSPNRISPPSAGSRLNED